MRYIYIYVCVCVCVCVTMFYLQTFDLCISGCVLRERCTHNSCVKVIRDLLQYCVFHLSNVCCVILSLVNLT